MADEQRTDVAPHPWRIEEPNKHYFRIVDAAYTPICDFFPEAVWSRGRDATLAIAQRIVRLANSEKSDDINDGSSVTALAHRRARR
jgi:hypothetical protein